MNNTVLLSQTENHFANTQLEAEALLGQLKQKYGANIQKNSITKKSKKVNKVPVQYFVVSITVVFEKVTDLL